MKYDELLNHKSILDCENPKDEEQHNKDLISMFGKADSFAKYGAIVQIKSVDEAHKNNEADYRTVCPGEYISVIDGCDVKNGADVVVNEGFFGFVAYGQGYTLNGDDTYHLIETLCTFRFFNKDADFDKFQDMEQKDLKREFAEGTVFCENEELLLQVRGVRRKDLDVLIKEAEEKRNEKGNNKGREKDKNKGRS